MTNNSKTQEKKEEQNQNATATDGKSVYAKKKAKAKKEAAKPKRENKDEFDQRIIDIARVTRVMAGGKRMRFRACVVVGDKKSKVGVGLAKGADVTLAVNKAVSRAKKDMVDVPLVDNTIPHAIEHKFGAAKVVLKPARTGRGVIAGGVMRIILDMAGVQNATCKNLGTSNRVNITKCTVRALSELKRVENAGKSKKGKKDKTAAATGKADKQADKPKKGSHRQTGNQEAGSSQAKSDK